MSDQNPSNPQNNDLSTQLPPPSGAAENVDRYLTQLIELINTDKLLVSHTDLAKFDPTSLQDHYRLELKNYEVEVSHNKQPDSGKDFYVILFNNLKAINERCAEKVILAYLYITEDKFSKFKFVADDQLERKRKEAEEKRFKAAMAPIDQALAEISSSSQTTAADQTGNPQQSTPLGYQHTFLNPTTSSGNNPSVFVTSS